MDILAVIASRNAIFREALTDHGQRVDAFAAEVEAHDVRCAEVEDKLVAMLAAAGQVA